MQTADPNDAGMLVLAEQRFITDVHFPQVVDNKIASGEFLSAARQVVRIVEKLGKVFAPVKYDMQGNINKLNSCLVMDRDGNATLQDMILFELRTEPENNLVATDALMWLTRALHMILLFFENIVDDNKTSAPSEDLVAILRGAYKIALEPYHGWMAQQLFTLLSRAIPTRTQLLHALADGQAMEDDALLKEMESYLFSLRMNVETIQNFYRDNNLENTSLA